MKSLSALAIVSGVSGAITMDELLVVLGAVVTIINIVIEVIKAIQKQRELPARKYTNAELDEMVDQMKKEADE